MATNPNGKNQIKLEIPCCNDESLEIIYKTPDNKLPFTVFQMLSERIGVQSPLTKSADGGVTIMKGTG